MIKYYTSKRTAGLVKTYEEILQSSKNYFEKLKYLDGREYTQDDVTEFTTRLLRMNWLEVSPRLVKMLHGDRDFISLALKKAISGDLESLKKDIDSRLVA